MADFIERERAASVHAVEGMAATVRKAWEAACRHDSIAPEAAFVVFSAGNPFVRFYERAKQQFDEMAAANAVLGYVGIDMHGKLVEPRRRRRGQ